MATNNNNQDVKVTLHWLNGSRAQGILWLLEELGIPYELEVYHRQPNLMAPVELEKIHPLGKSPLVTIAIPGRPEPLVLAESAFIAQYLCDHWGQDKTLVPKKWKDGQEGKVGGETEGWLRYHYHFSALEGSYFPYVWLGLILNAGLKGPVVPWLVRPITSLVANKISEVLVFPNVNRHFKLLEEQLKTSPNGGKYLCGEHLTVVDILFAFPLIANQSSLNALPGWEKGTPAATYPRLHEYIDQLQAEPGWKRAGDKIRDIEGHFSVKP